MRSPKKKQEKTIRRKMRRHKISSAANVFVCSILAAQRHVGRMTTNQRTQTQILDITTRDTHRREGRTALFIQFSSYDRLWGELLRRSSLPSVPPLGPALTRAPLAIDGALPRLLMRKRPQEHFSKKELHFPAYRQNTRLSQPIGL